MKQKQFDPILFGDNNYMEIANITCTPEPATPIDYVRTPERAEQLRITNLENDIVIDFDFDDPIYASYFAIPGSNLTVDAEVKLEIFETIPSTQNLLPDEWTKIGEMVPVGQWKAGIDVFGEEKYPSLNAMNVIWFNGLLKLQRGRLTIKHGYGAAYVPPEDPPPVEVPDGIFRQDDATGVLSIEAESGETVDEGLDSWNPTSESGSSGGTSLFKSGNDFYSNPNEGPRVNFEFTPSRTGTHNVWVRIKSDEGNSFYTIYDGNSKTKVVQAGQIFNQGWIWVKSRDIYTVAENKKTITIAARDHFIHFDKIVIVPNGDPAPTGTGPAESGEGTKLVAGDGTTLVNSSDNVSFRMFILGNTTSLQFNFSYGSRFKQLTDPDLHEVWDGFSVISREQNASRSLSLPFEMMSDVDRLVLSRMESRLAGKPFLVSAYPKLNRASWFTNDYLFLGRFATALDYLHLYENIHQTSINILEA